MIVKRLNCNKENLSNERIIELHILIRQENLYANMIVGTKALFLHHVISEYFSKYFQ